jgi:DNA-binding beta-propeller fold protein YncE
LTREFLTRLSRLSALAALVALLVLPAAAAARQQGQQRATKRGTLTQLKGTRGCLSDGGKAKCAKARALDGPGPFMGSRAIAVSPDGKNVYVASSKSNAIAIFQRDKATGTLTQASGTGGCIAAKGAEGCAVAIGLDGPNSVAVSPDGKNVYATSRSGNSLTSFRRNPKTGALKQLPPTSAGCYSALPVPGCATGRALLGPDVVVVSPDGKNVYTGSFFGNAVAAFSRNIEESGGALTQLAGAAGCVAESSAEGCAPGIALGAVEGLAVSRDGNNVYTGSALSNAIAVLGRNPESGALTQASDGTGCIANAALAGCTKGAWVEGANAVATSPGNDVVYVTSLLSNSVTTFQPSTTSAGLKQKEGPAGCALWLKAAGCGFAQAMSAPEGIAVSPDGASVYVAAFRTGALDVFDRNRETGTVLQKPNRAGCLAAKKEPICARGRALAGVSSIAVSPDNRSVYTTSFFSDAVDVLRRHP